MAKWNEKLIKAAREGSLKDLKLSIENGADLEYRDKNFYTPLLTSVLYGHLDTVQYLVSVGCKVEARTKDGNTPLCIAVYKGNLQIVQYLMSVSCERDAIGNNGLTPLMFAVQEGHLEIAEFLVKAGCDIESKTKTILEACPRFCVGYRGSFEQIYHVKEGYFGKIPEKRMLNFASCKAREIHFQDW